MLAVTLITAGVIIAFIVGGKEEKPQLLEEDDDDSYSPDAWRNMVYLKNVSEEIVNRRNQWISLFESSDNMVFQSEHLRKRTLRGGTSTGPSSGSCRAG